MVKFCLDCGRIAYYYLKGSPPEYCYIHKKDGYVRKHSLCFVQNCGDIANYGLRGGGRSLCSQHSRKGFLGSEGAELFVSKGYKYCQYPGCENKKSSELPKGSLNLRNSELTKGNSKRGTYYKFCGNHIGKSLPDEYLQKVKEILQYKQIYIPKSEQYEREELRNICKNIIPETYMKRLKRSKRSSPDETPILMENNILSKEDNENILSKEDNENIEFINIFIEKLKDLEFRNKVNNKLSYIDLTIIKLMEFK